MEEDKTNNNANKNYRTPFYETWRPFTDKKGYQHKDYLYHSYIKYPDFSDQPLKYITEFQLITKDLVSIFDFIEPSDSNFKCYSNRIYKVFIRTCIAIESNFKSILKKNGYKKDKKEENDWNIKDYYKLEKTHKLSEYHVEIFRFHQTKFTPFQDWNETKEYKNETKKYKPLSWWQAYNDVKHNRVNKFDQANLENLLNAVCALLVVLTSRVHNINNFIKPQDIRDISNNILTRLSGVDIATYTANIEKCFKIIYPSIDKWNEEDKYELNEPFRKLFK
jgi:hypothetical protein